MFTFDGRKRWVSLDYHGTESQWVQMTIPEFCRAVGLDCERDGKRFLVRDPDWTHEVSKKGYLGTSGRSGRKVAVKMPGETRSRELHLYWELPENPPHVLDLPSHEGYGWRQWYGGELVPFPGPLPTNHFATIEEASAYKAIYAPTKSLVLVKVTTTPVMVERYEATGPEEQ